MPEVKGKRGFLQRPQAAQVQFNDSLVRREFTGENKGQKPRISPGEAGNRKTGLRTSEKSFKKNRIQKISLAIQQTGNWLKGEKHGLISTR